jgi:hypothetical protein
MVDACGCCCSREGNKQQVVFCVDCFCKEGWNSISYVNYFFWILYWCSVCDILVVSAGEWNCLCLSFYSFWSFDVKGLLYLVQLLHMKIFTCTHALAVEFLVWMIISVSWNILWRNKWSRHLSLFLPSLCIFSWIACCIECSTLTEPR